MVKPLKCLACKTSSLMKLLSKTPMGSTPSWLPGRKGLMRAVCIALLAIFVASPLYAQEKKEERKTKQTAAMSQQVYEELMKIQVR